LKYYKIQDIFYTDGQLKHCLVLSILYSMFHT